MFRNFFGIYDTETTSNEPLQDAIISIGIVVCKFEGNKFIRLDDFHSFVFTNRDISSQAIAIHHIDKSMIQDAPKFPEAINLLKTFIKQFLTQPTDRFYLMAHNGKGFDDIIMFCNFIKNRMNFDQFLLDIQCHGFIDSLPMLRRLLKSKPIEQLPKNTETGKMSFQLGDCHEFFCGNRFSDAHDALADSLALYNIMNSDKICCMMNTVKLFEFVIPKAKAVSTIKSRCGMAFQRQEDKIKMDEAKKQREEKKGDAESDYDFEQYSDDEEEEEKSTGIGSRRPATQIKNIPLIPIFRPTAEEKNEPTTLILCLNCMSFVQTKTHMACKLPTVGYNH